MARQFADQYLDVSPGAFGDVQTKLAATGGKG
jgi:hypothetical protein